MWSLVFSPPPPPAPTISIIGSQQADGSNGVSSKPARPAQSDAVCPLPLHPHHHPQPQRAHNATPSSVGSVTPDPGMDPGMDPGSTNSLVLPAGTVSGKGEGTLAVKQVPSAGPVVLAAATSAGDAGKVELGVKLGGQGEGNGVGLEQGGDKEAAPPPRSPRMDYSLFLFSEKNPLRALATAVVRDRGLVD
jgi:hypothetical protein